MTKRPGTATRVALLAAGVFAIGVEGARPDPATAPGESLYRRYCAACHGTSGRGDGPAAAGLCPPPSDLTRTQSGIPELMRQIDGRRSIGAHGTAAMPVWGEVFEQSLIGEPNRRRTALHAVQTLADYIRRLPRADTDIRP